MFTDFQIAAIVKQGSLLTIMRIPINSDLHEKLMGSWFTQLSRFIADIEEIDFNPGFHPDNHQMFCLNGYNLPEWIQGIDSHTILQGEAIQPEVSSLCAIKGIIAFCRSDSNEEFVLFQNFSQSHVIRPGRFIFMTGDTYRSTHQSGITLGKRLSAVYKTGESKLLFRNFRAVNTFLPLSEFYDEASEHEIREILSHQLIAPEDIDSFALHSNQWFRKRFAMLKDSAILDQFSARDIARHSQNYDVNIRIESNRIVFPTDRDEAKRLLLYLNEEVYRGAITDKLYETNSRRETV